MKVIFTPAIFLFAIALHAQVTITNSIFPGAGHSLYYQTSFALQGFEPGQAGADQQWDMTQLTVHSSDTMHFFHPAEGNYSGSFVFADFMIKMDSAEVYGRTLATRVEMIGIAGPDPSGFGLFDSINVPINPPQRLYEAPLVFGHTSQHNAEIKITLPGIPELEGLELDIDSVRIKLVTKRSDEVDAYGTLMLPGGTYQVLRQRQETITSIEVELLIQLLPPPIPPVWVNPSQFGLDIGLPSDTSMAYVFFAEGQKGHVARIDMADEEEVMSVQYKTGDNVTGVRTDLSTMGFRVFPNPASHTLVIESPEGLEQDYVFNLYDISGKVAAHGQFSGSHQLNVSSLPGGTYILALYHNDQRIGSKAILIR